MPRRPVSETLAEKFLVLHESGVSFRKIGQDHGLDWRTIRDAVDRMAGLKTASHWEAVHQKVDGEALARHYQQLLDQARQLHAVVERDPLAEPETWLSDSDYLAKLLDGRLGANPPDAGSSIEQQVRQGRLLLRDLQRHEPELVSPLNVWQGEWYAVQAERQDLVDTAEAMLNVASKPGDGWRELAKALAQGLSVAVCRDQPVPVFEETPTPDGVLPGGAALTFGTSKVVSATRQNRQVLRKAGEAVLPQLERRVVQSDVRAHYLGAAHARERIEATIDRVMLRGVFGGTCELFPSRAVP
jgi:hypothetical protein